VLACCSVAAVLKVNPVSRFLWWTANWRWDPARLRCQLLRDAAVRQKMGPVSGAHPILARLTPRRTSPDPRTRGCVTSILQRGVISILRLHAKNDAEDQLWKIHALRLREALRRFHHAVPPNPANALPNNGKAAGSGTTETSPHPLMQVTVPLDAINPPKWICDGVRLRGCRNPDRRETKREL
jgi:hypothetical protein